MKPIYITSEDYKILSAILHEYPYEVFVFGSRITGTHKKFSDLDICLKSKSPISLRDLAFIKIAFSESALPFKVDVIDYHDLSGSFRKLIDQEALKFNDTTPCISNH